MIKLIHCPFCGGEYFLLGHKENLKPSEHVTCPDCGRSIGGATDVHDV